MNVQYVGTCMILLWEMRRTVLHREPLLKISPMTGFARSVRKGKKYLKLFHSMVHLFFGSFMPGIEFSGGEIL